MSRLLGKRCGKHLSLCSIFHPKIFSFMLLYLHVTILCLGQSEDYETCDENGFDYESDWNTDSKLSGGITQSNGACVKSV